MTSKIRRKRNYSDENLFEKYVCENIFFTCINEYKSIFIIMELSQSIFLKIIIPFWLSTLLIQNNRKNKPKLKFYLNL